MSGAWTPIPLPFEDVGFSTGSGLGALDRASHHCVRARAALAASLLDGDANRTVHSDGGLRIDDPWGSPILSMHHANGTLVEFSDGRRSLLRLRTPLPIALGREPAEGLDLLLGAACAFFCLAMMRADDGRAPALIAKALAVLLDTTMAHRDDGLASWLLMPTPWSPIAIRTTRPSTASAIGLGTPVKGPLAVHAPMRIRVDAEYPKADPDGDRVIAMISADAFPIDIGDDPIAAIRAFNMLPETVRAPSHDASESPCA